MDWKIFEKRVKNDLVLEIRVLEEMDMVKTLSDKVASDRFLAGQCPICEGGLTFRQKKEDLYCAKCERGWTADNVARFGNKTAAPKKRFSPGDIILPLFLLLVILWEGISAAGLKEIVFRATIRMAFFAKSVFSGKRNRSGADT